MCENCHGRGVYYTYERSFTQVMPCPDDVCREVAQAESKEVMERIKKKLGMEVFA